jgi:hypothetical protein
MSVSFHERSEKTGRHTMLAANGLAMFLPFALETSLRPGAPSGTACLIFD